MNILERLLAERGSTLARTEPPPGPVASEFSPLQYVLERSGMTLEELRAGAETDTPDQPSEVKDTPELRRIVDLPRRPCEGPEELAKQMSEAFRTPWGQQSLRPIQALAFHDLHQFGGLFGPIRVGGGKTLISYLAPSVVDAKRPLLVIPAKLKEKTRREFRKLAAHWLGPHPDAYRIATYEFLGRKGADEFLRTYRPDFLCLDEGHKAKNRRAAVTRKLDRYVHDNPGTPVVVMSGTMTKRSQKDCAHLARWTLPRCCPFAMTWTDLEAMAAALDEKVTVRARPGALSLLLDDEDRKELAEVGEETPGELSVYRRAFRRRMVETPGVVATQDGALGVSLTISSLFPSKEDPAVDTVFETFRDKWELPDGHPIADGIAHWRHARELGLGLFYRWNPRPPEWWLEPRRMWAKFSREVLKYNRRGLDSEAQVVLAVEKGWYQDHGLLAAWRAVKDKFTPNTEAVWISSEALEVGQRWMEENPGIVWVEHVEYGRELSRRSGVPFYAAKGLDPSGRFIEDHPHGKPLIASIASNYEGRNLQYGWSANLAMPFPPNGSWAEQFIGRTHRDGQEAEEVSVEPYVGCYEHAAGFWQAVADSKYQQDLTGQAQKLQYADTDFPDMATVMGRAGGPGTGRGWFRWVK